MAMDGMILVANPGSASRKYTLFLGEQCLIKIHFEMLDNKVVYSYRTTSQEGDLINANVSHITFAATKLREILSKLNVLDASDKIEAIALRIVAPSSYFQQHRVLDKKTLDKLAGLESRAQLHINASLQEAHILQAAFAGAKLIGVSDSAFHATLPAHANNYALPINDAIKLDIKRFGYHGLSVESAVNTLKALGTLPLRIIVCHLGSGASVTAVKAGRSIDTTMGYSPLEGLVMSTRSGTLDITAAQVLQEELNLSGEKLQNYLNNKSGLLGLSDGTSSDIKTLLKAEREGNKKAKMALDTYIYHVQMAIGQMSAALGGIDTLVFTGTVGERSAPIRRRVVSGLLFLGLEIDVSLNSKKWSKTIHQISPKSHPAKIYVIPSNEDKILAKHARN